MLTPREARDLIDDLPDPRSAPLARAPVKVAPPERRPRRLGTTDGRTFAEQEIESPLWLVEKYVPAAGLCLIGGLPKSTKSWLGLDLVLAVISGQTFLAQPIAQAGRAVLIDAETPRKALQTRVRQLAAGRRIMAEDLARLHIVDRARIDLDNRDDRNDLASIIAEHQPSIVVVDPLAEHHGRCENDPEMAGVMGHLREMTHLGAAVVAVHHFSKSDQAGRRTGALLRGHNSIWAATDASIFVTRKDREVSLGFESRYIEDQRHLRVRLDVDEASIVPAARIAVLDSDTGRTALGAAVMAALETAPAGMTISAIRTQVRRSAADVRAALGALEAAGDAARADLGNGPDLWTTAGTSRDVNGTF